MRRLKAFTLIELIVVIAIFGIIMVGIMNLIEPINDASQTQKVANVQRRIQGNITTYIGENLRYAQNLVIVKGGSFDQAIERFIDYEPKDMNGKPVDYSTEAARNDIKVICFDGKTAIQYADTPAKFNGRLIRTNNDYSGYKYSTIPGADTHYKDGCSVKGDKNLYLVFGEDYYSHADYYLQASFEEVNGYKTLKLDVDSDFYYNASKRKSLSTAHNPGELDLILTEKYNLLNAGNNGFVFEIVDSAVAHTSACPDRITSAASTRSAKECIYFVFDGGESISHINYDPVVPDPVPPRKNEGGNNEKPEKPRNANGDVVDDIGIFGGSTAAGGGNFSLNNMTSNIPDEVMNSKSDIYISLSDATDPSRHTIVVITRGEGDSYSVKSYTMNSETNQYVQDYKTTSGSGADCTSWITQNIFGGDTYNRKGGSGAVDYITLGKQDE